jgi:hypothetical protein
MFQDPLPIFYTCYSRAHLVSEQFGQTDNCLFYMRHSRAHCLFYMCHSRAHLVSEQFGIDRQG